jgi:hypothetical protein
MGICGERDGAVRNRGHGSGTVAVPASGQEHPQHVEATRMTHARSRSSIAAVAAVFLFALGVSTATARVTPEQFSLRWAWVTVRMPAATYDPAPKDQGNSTGSTNHVS